MTNKSEKLSHKQKRKAEEKSLSLNAEDVSSVVRSERTTVKTVDQVQEGQVNPRAHANYQHWLEYFLKLLEAGNVPTLLTSANILAYASAILDFFTDTSLAKYFLEEARMDILEAISNLPKHEKERFKGLLLRIPGKNILLELEAKKKSDGTLSFILRRF